MQNLLNYSGDILVKCNNTKLYKRSETLYKKYIDGSLNAKIKNRCCNFLLLKNAGNIKTKEKSLVLFI